MGAGGEGERSWSLEDEVRGGVADKADDKGRGRRVFGEGEQGVQRGGGGGIVEELFEARGGLLC